MSTKVVIPTNPSSAGVPTFREAEPRASIRDRVVVASIAPTERLINRSYGSFHLLPCPKDKPYILLVIEEQTDYKRLVQDGVPGIPMIIEYVPYPIKALVVAKDLLGTENLEREGVFVCAGAAPTEGELESARARRIRWLTECVREGDMLYTKHGPRAIEQIPDYCKRAVEELGEKRDWVFVPGEQKVQCPGCGTMVSLLRDGRIPAICTLCRAPINKELAIELNLWVPPQRSMVGEGEDVAVTKDTAPGKPSGPAGAPGKERR